MAKGIKTGGRDFTPGNAPVSPGRPSVPKDIKEFRKITSVEVSRIYNKFFHMELAELKKVLSEPSTTVIELIVGKIMFESIRKGDQMRLNALLERLIGKVPNDVRVGIGDENSGGAKITLYLPENNRMKKPEDNGES